MVLRVIFCLLLPLLAVAEVTVTQITYGPEHHFYGYIGHVGNTPWSGDGKHMVMLRTTFQDRMPVPEDAADIVLLDVENDYALTKIEETRGWNPQQGTMLYWNSDAPDTQFFFNDRDPETQKLFCVLYDIEQRKRVREYRFDDVSIGNGGIAQNGGYFLGLNYGRMDRLRRVTGYRGAYDWTVGVNHPEDDGVYKVNVETGENVLLASFSRLGEAARVKYPEIDRIKLFINHSLWSRTDERIMFYLRGNWNIREKPRVNAFFTMDADGSNLTLHDVFPGGHPEWQTDTRMIGTVDRKQIVYDVDQMKIVETMGGREIFPDPEGDIALSRDGKWFVNGAKRREGNIYTIYNMETGAYLITEPLNRGEYLSGDLRLDPAPTWRPDAKAIAVPAIAEDGTRQTFIIEFDHEDVE